MFIGSSLRGCGSILSTGVCKSYEIIFDVRCLVNLTLHHIYNTATYLPHSYISFPLRNSYSDDFRSCLCSTPASSINGLHKANVVLYSGSLVTMPTLPNLIHSGHLSNIILTFSPVFY